MLVLEQGWSSDEYEKWLTRLLIQTLLKNPWLKTIFQMYRIVYVVEERKEKIIFYGDSFVRNFLFDGLYYRLLQGSCSTF